PMARSFATTSASDCAAAAALVDVAPNFLAASAATMAFTASLRPAVAKFGTWMEKGSLDMVSPVSGCGANVPRDAFPAARRDAVHTRTRAAVDRWTAERAWEGIPRLSRGET